jgi:hypothetical protein
MSSLTYQHAPQNVLFDIGTRINILSNKVCDMMKELGSLTASTITFTNRDDVMTNLQLFLRDFDESIFKLNLAVQPH